MAISFKKIALTLSFVFALTAAVNAQSYHSKSWSNSWSKSAGSSWGTRADGTTFQSGFNHANRQSKASSTTGNGFQSNTTTMQQNQSSRQGYAASNGPNGSHFAGYTDNSGNLAINNTRRQRTPFGSVVDSNNLKLNYRNQNLQMAGYGPSGNSYSGQHQRSTGNLSIGRDVSVNNVFGKNIRLGGTQSAGFDLRKGSSNVLFTSGQKSNTNYNTLRFNSGGSGYLQILP